MENAHFEKNHERSRLINILYFPHSFLLHFQSSKTVKQMEKGNEIEKSGLNGLFLLFKVLKITISKNKHVFPEKGF